MTRDHSHAAALEYALRSRERHGIQLNGTCRYCRTIWPCEAFWLAQHAARRLSTADRMPQTEPTVPWKLFTRRTGEVVHVGERITSRHGRTGTITALELMSPDS